MQPDPLGDLTTELERSLGKIVKEKYGTDFYILYRYPLAVRTLSHLQAAYCTFSLRRRPAALHACRDQGRPCPCAVCLASFNNGSHLVLSQQHLAKRACNLFSP